MDEREKLGLSLVAVPHLNLRDLEHQTKLGKFSSYALAPSHLKIEGRGFIGKATLQRASEIMGICREINSLQGVFFGLDQPNKAELDNRIKNLVEICEELACRNIVVGAPDFRVNEALWCLALERLESICPPSINVSIENLCTGDCCISPLHPWGPSSLGSFSPALDISNSLECTQLRPEEIVAIEGVTIIHLSGPRHSSAVTGRERALFRSVFLSDGSQIPVVEVVADTLAELFSKGTEVWSKMSADGKKYSDNNEFGNEQ